MFSEKEKKDLDLLVEIGEKQSGKISSMLVSNYWVELSSEKQTEEMYNRIKAYLNKMNIEVIDDVQEQDAEVENDEQTIPMIRPFDPSKIDIDMKTMELSSLIKRLQYKEIDMNTDFQRKGGLWTDIQKSQLIESLFLRIPIPAFYFDGGIVDSWLIIDGLQRLTALKEFVIDKTLKLTGLEFFSDLNGLTFSELPRAFVRRIEETNIVAYIVKSGTPVNVKYNIFKRINTGGLELKPQEIRHALYQGNATKICKKFAKIQEFLSATTFSIKEDRMMDQEFVLRFIAVCYYGIEKFEGVPDNYLNGAMEFLNSKECVDEELMEQQFIRVMRYSRIIMGKYAFRKLGENGMRRPINKAIYEAWCRSMFVLNDSELKKLAEEKKEVYKRFMKLCNDEVFLQIIKASDKKSFLFRFTRIENLLRGVLDDTKNRSIEF